MSSWHLLIRELCNLQQERQDFEVVVFEGAHGEGINPFLFVLFGADSAANVAHGGESVRLGPCLNVAP